MEQLKVDAVAEGSSLGVVGVVGPAASGAHVERRSSLRIRLAVSNFTIDCLHVICVYRADIALIKKLEWFGTDFARVSLGSATVGLGEIAPGRGGGLDDRQ